MVQAPEWWADPRPPTLPSLSGKDHPQKKPWQSRQARRLLERPGRGQGLQQPPPGGQDSPSRSWTVDGPPGPQGGWGDLGVLEQNQDQGSAFTNRTLCTTIYKTQPWVFRLRWCKTIVLLPSLSSYYWPPDRPIIKRQIVGARNMTLFGKPANRQDGRLIHPSPQRTILPELEFRFLLH